MGNDSMVKVDNVSMRFNLGIEKNYSMKQALIEAFSAKKRAEKKAKKEGI